MNIFKQIFKVIRLLNSNLSPSMIALAGSIGVFWGMSPFLSPHNLLLLFIVIILRTPINFVLLSMVFFLPFSYIFADSINALGNTILAIGSLSPLFTSLYNSFFIITKFNNTFIMGSFVISLILFIPTFIGIKTLVTKHREAIKANLLSSALYKNVLKKTILFDLLLNIKNNSQEDDSSSSPKNKKSKALGTIDWKFLAPILVVLIIVIIGTKFFLDNAIKDLIEKQGTEYNQAVVELRRFNSTFTEAEVSLHNLQWTDKQKPLFNLFQFDKFSANASLLPLLRGRFVMEELVLNGLRLNVPRKKSGEIVKEKVGQTPSLQQDSLDTPPAQTRQEDSETSEEKGFGSELKQNSQELLDDLLQKAKTDVKNQGDKVIKQNQKIIDSYKQQISELEKSLNLQAAVDNLNSIDINKINDFPSALEAGKKIGGIDNSIKNANDAYRQVSELKRNMEQDLKQLHSSISVDNIRENLKNYTLRILGLNSLSLTAFSEKAFGPAITSQIKFFLEQYRKYKHLLVAQRDEIKLEEEKVAYDPSIRSGRDILYRVDTPYPRFYVNKIYGTGDPNVNGVYRLNIDNLGSNPEYAPIRNDISLKYNAFNIDLKGDLSINKDRVNVAQKITAHPFAMAEVISISPNILFQSLEQGNATASAELSDRNQVITMTAFLEVTDVVLSVNPNLQKDIKQVLQDTLTKIKKLNFKIAFQTDESDNYKLRITSNLDQLLKANISGYFQKYAAEKQKEVLRKLDKAIEPTLAQVSKDLQANSGSGIFNGIDEQIEALLKGSKAIQNKMDQLKKEEEDKVLNQAKKVVPEEIKIPTKVKSPF